MKNKSVKRSTSKRSTAKRSSVRRNVKRRTVKRSQKGCKKRGGGNKYGGGLEVFKKLSPRNQESSGLQESPRSGPCIGEIVNAIQSCNMIGNREKDEILNILLPKTKEDRRQQNIRDLKNAPRLFDLSKL